MARIGIAPIDLVRRQPLPVRGDGRAAAPRYEDCIENIDIGGPAMIRSAAKNHALRRGRHRSRATTRRVLAELAANGGALTLATAPRLAAKAFARTAAYDAAIAELVRRASSASEPPALLARLRRHAARRRCATARTRTRRRRSTSPARRAPGVADGRAGAGQGALLQQPQRHRRRLRAASREFDRRAGGGRSSSTPTPAASRSARSLAEAYGKALRCDPVSAFGGIVALNRTLDARAAAGDRRDLHRGDHRAGRRRRRARRSLAREEEPAPAARPAACPIRAQPGADGAQRRRRLPGADPRQRGASTTATLQGRDEARADRRRSSPTCCSPCASAST